MSRSLVREDLYQLKFLSQPALSPCGQQIAFVRSYIDEKSGDYRSDIYIRDRRGNEPRQLTYGSKHDNTPVFSPDGSRLAFVSDRTGEKQIWLLDLRGGGEARQLTSLRYGAQSPVWSPDGTRIAFTGRLTWGEDMASVLVARSAADKEAEEKKRRESPQVIDRIRYKSNEAFGFTDGRTSHIFVTDLGSDRDPLCLTEGDFDHQSPSWSPGGEEIVFVANRDRDPDPDPSYMDVYKVGADGGPIQRLTDTKGPKSSPRFSPCGRYIAFAGHEAEHLGATLGRVWLMSGEGGSLKCLTASLDNTVGDVTNTDSRYGGQGEVLQFSPDGTMLTFLASDRGSTHIFSVSVSGGPVNQITAGKRHVQAMAAEAHDGTLVYTAADIMHPARLFALTGSGEEMLLDPNSDWLPAVNLGEVSEHWWQGVDGWSVHGWLIKPPGFSSDRRYPLIMQIHGGPHTQYGFSFFHEYQMLAALGYAVVYVNPRGSHGYGQDFVDAVRGDYGGADYGDLMAVIQQVAELPWIDETRLGVTGGSYGGFMTNWMVGHTDMFKAAVTQRCISNWMSFYGVSDIGYYFTEYEVGGNPWDDVEMMLRHSPISYVRNMRTPLLIIHSEQDMRCPIEQAEQLFIYLKRLGVKTRLVRFNGANHDLSRNGKPALRLERLKHISEWFAEHL